MSSIKKTIAVIGAAIAGFTAGILSAPKSGKETREDLKKKADEIKQTADKRANQAKRVAKDSAKSVKTGAKKAGDAMAETARDIKSNVDKQFK